MPFNRSDFNKKRPKSKMKADNIPKLKDMIIIFIITIASVASIGEPPVTFTIHIILHKLNGACKAYYFVKQKSFIYLHYLNNRFNRFPFSPDLCSP